MAPEDFRRSAEQLALSEALAAKVFRVNIRTVRRWLSGETPAPGWVELALWEMEEWQIEPLEWRRAQDNGICTGTGGRWLHSLSDADLAEQGLERAVVNGRWTIQKRGTRAARWNAPIARREPSS